MTIPTKDLHKALTQRRDPECTHPTYAIRDLPDRSYCRKCGQDVPPPGRYEDGSGPGQKMDWMGRTKKSVFPVFPSSGEE